MKHFLNVRKAFIAFLLVSIVAVMPVMAQGVGKNVTLALNQVTVKTFFSELKKQTGLNFVYSSDLAQSLPKVTVNAQNKPTKQVLDEVMDKINCQYEIEKDVVTVTRRLSGKQTRTVTGHVTDEDGLALPGVTICIDDSKVCTITDSEGFYTLKVPSGKCSLKVSYIGMADGVIALRAGNTALKQDIIMHSDNSLDEVIVTGYQDISKPKMTGSAVVITSDQLTERYTGSIVSNLEGRVAGLSTYGGNLKVRGTSSLYAETKPLLVVDGLPMEGRLDDLNQFDIASINVLKDAAAAAIYGARASNGVIVVTTKNANKAGKIDVDFTANISISDKRNYDYNDNFYMNPEQQIAKQSEYFDYLYLGEKSADAISRFEKDISSGSSAISKLEEGYYRLAKGELSASDLAALKTKLAKNNFAKDYADAIYKNQVLQEYNLSLRSRSDKGSNNLTLNLQHDNAGVINAMDRRITANYKGSFDVAKWLTANMNINAVFNKSKGAGYDYTANNSIWAFPAYENFYNEDGTVADRYGLYDGNHLYQWQEGITPLAYNPIEERYNNVETTKRNHMRFHGDLLFKIFKGFTVNTQFVYETEHVTAETYANEKSHAARVLKNAYAYKNADGTIGYRIMETGGFKSARNADGDFWTARAQANYANTFGKHSVNALAGLEFRETLSRGTSSIQVGYDDQLQTGNSAITDFGTLANMTYSDYFMKNSGTGYSARQFAYGVYLQGSMQPIPEVKHRYASGYANATYTYDERYNVFGSFRKDYADVYGLNAKYRGKPLWSLGAAWNIDKEDFMKSVEFVNFLKLRFSYGATGNIYQGASSYLTAKTGKLTYWTNVPFANIISPANPLLTWEKTYTTNIGVDFSLWNNRVRGAIDYYHKKATDVFSNKTLDPTTGFTSMFVNAANMVNNGIELQVTADWFRPAARNQFGWSTSLTLAHNSNEVTSVENPATRAYELISTPFKEGYPASAVWSYRFAGIDGSKYNEKGELMEQPYNLGSPGQTLWYGDDDVVSHSPSSGSPEILEYSGQRDPKVVMSLDNRFEWNGFSLSIMMAYYGGHVMRALPEVEVFSDTYGTLAEYFVNSWSPENDKSLTPGWGRYSSQAIGREPSNGNNSIHKADFIKIRNIVLGYSFPKEWLKPCHINRANLQFQINNPGFIWRANKVNVDPETMGVSLPASYVFTLNLNL